MQTENIQNQLNYLEQMYPNAEHFQPQGKIKNALSNNTVKFMDSSELRVDTSEGKIGEVIFLKQDKYLTDFNNVNITVINTCAFEHRDWEDYLKNGISRNKTQFLIEAYKKDYLFPDINFVKYLTENPNKLNLKEDEVYLLLGIFFLIPDLEGSGGAYYCPSVTLLYGKLKFWHSFMGTGMGFCPKTILVNK